MGAGGDFNLIANLREKKGGQGILDKYQDALSEFISQILMVDVETGSGWFTWNNIHGGEHPVASRLDCFLVSKNIMHSSREFVVNVLPTAGSDHWPIYLSWDWSCSPMGKPFCFEILWMEHKYFKDLVSQWWPELVPPPGTNMFRFQQKLKALKAKICMWNKEEFGNIFEDKKKLLL